MPCSIICGVLDEWGRGRGPIYYYRNIVFLAASLASLADVVPLGPVSTTTRFVLILSNMARRFQTLTAIAVAALALFATAKPTGNKKRAISSIVTGTPMGFASGTTGGGDATPVYPTTIDELKSYLTSSEPQNIVISGTFNFQSSEGSLIESACNAYSCTPDEGGQALLNTLSGCGSLSTYSVEIDAAAYNPIWVASDKTLVGMNNAVLYGKGLRFSGVSNIIIQNVAITNLNPKYVWGGDAIAVTGSSNIWFDHIAVSFTWWEYTGARTLGAAGRGLSGTTANLSPLSPRPHTWAGSTTPSAPAPAPASPSPTATSQA